MSWGLGTSPKPCPETDYHHVTNAREHSMGNLKARSRNHRVLAYAIDILGVGKARRPGRRVVRQGSTSENIP